MSVLDFFDIYTSLAKQLFEALAEAHQLTRPDEYNDRTHCYVWIDDILSKNYEDDDIGIKDCFTLSGKQWNWYTHAPHCDFACLDDADKTNLEANWYNYNIVDSGFLTRFLLTYPPAKKAISGFEVDFHTITDMLEKYVKDGYLYRIENSVDFIRLEHIIDKQTAAEKLKFDNIHTQ
ncbi:MAG: hypothetical protein FWB96_04095 [Defluviitaleaceae bacterium]|nr:hypothetical protein [Defluviitaleaceae bacterium]MCL2262096.1 hypothetical protein [Defluviitaleaceae bacterium]